MGALRQKRLLFIETFSSRYKDGPRPSFIPFSSSSSSANAVSIPSGLRIARLEQSAHPLQRLGAGSRPPESMACFPCISPRRREPRSARKGTRLTHSSGTRSLSRLVDTLEYERKLSWGECEKPSGAHSFSFKELAVATKNFRESNLIGEGGFGKVFKGFLENQVVAIKQLNREGMQGNQEFLVEVLMLIMLRHVNLVTLIGFCAEKEERLLVYEYMANGSLENHLFDLRKDQVPLSWNTRVKIALGAAKGLAYLHDVANPPVIYRDLKSANILLDEDFNPKLSDFGLAKVGPVGDDTHVSTRVMGTYGYAAPDYVQSGKLNVKSDVYSFGVVMLELITGRKAFDLSQQTGKQSLIAWSRPFIADRRRFTQLADPLLEGRYPLRALYQLASITSLCLHEHAEMRPVMREVVSALNYVASQPYGTTDSVQRNPSLPCQPDASSGSPTKSEEDDKKKVHTSSF